MKESAATRAGAVGGGGAREVRLFRNGLLVKSRKGDVTGGAVEGCRVTAPGTATCEATIPVAAGETHHFVYDAAGRVVDEYGPAGWEHDRVYRGGVGLLATEEATATCRKTARQFVEAFFRGALDRAPTEAVFYKRGESRENFPPRPPPYFSSTANLQPARQERRHS